MEENKTRSQQASKVTLVGLVLNVILAVLKYAAGILGNSSALVADATQSLTDIITDIIVLFGFRIVEKPADSNHQYGHGKVETLLASVSGVVLLLAGVGIFISGVGKIFHLLQGEIFKSPGIIALAASLLSVISKETVFRYTRAGAERLNSPTLMAKAWDHRSDALLSLSVMAGVGGSLLLGNKWIILDPIAAIVVSFFVVRVALGILADSLSELIEVSLDRDMKEKILQTILSVEGVRDTHHFRTRKIGHYFAIESHVVLDRDLGFVEAHDVSTVIEGKIHKKFGEETLITLHIEPMPPE